MFIYYRSTGLNKLCVSLYVFSAAVAQRIRDVFNCVGSTPLDHFFNFCSDQENFVAGPPAWPPDPASTLLLVYMYSAVCGPGRLRVSLQMVAQ